jgi:hypothetical protein
MRRLAALAALALFVACGHDATTTIQQPASNVARAWVAGTLPDGYSIVSADERAGIRRVGYAPNGEDEYRVAITVTTPTSDPLTRGRDPRSVKVRGHDATISVLTDEGHAYGFAVVWDERVDLRVEVDGANGPTEAETLTVAGNVRGITEPDWQRLLLELSVDTHVGRVDPTATPLDVVLGSVAGDEYVLTALLPGGYPLGPEDRRLDCFHLAFRASTTADFCPGHPIWARVAGQLFVFGDVSADTARVEITASYGSSFPAFTVDAVAPPQGPSTRFYVAPLPEGACAVTLDDADGHSPGPGPTGPLSEAGDDYARCLPLMTADPMNNPPNGPPTTPTSIN